MAFEHQEPPSFLVDLGWQHVAQIDLIVGRRVVVLACVDVVSGGTGTVQVSLDLVDVILNDEILAPLQVHRVYNLLMIEVDLLVEYLHFLNQFLVLALFV